MPEFDNIATIKTRFHTKFTEHGAENRKYNLEKKKRKKSKNILKRRQLKESAILDGIEYSERQAEMDDEYSERMLQRYYDRK